MRSIQISFIEVYKSWLTPIEHAAAKGFPVVCYSLIAGKYDVDWNRVKWYSCEEGYKDWCMLIEWEEYE